MDAHKKTSSPQAPRETPDDAFKILKYGDSYQPTIITTYVISRSIHLTEDTAAFEVHLSTGEILNGELPASQGLLYADRNDIVTMDGINQFVTRKIIWVNGDDLTATVWLAAVPTVPAPGNPPEESKQDYYKYLYRGSKITTTFNGTLTVKHRVIDLNPLRPVITIAFLENRTDSIMVDVTREEALAALVPGDFINDGVMRIFTGFDVRERVLDTAVYVPEGITIPSEIVTERDPVNTVISRSHRLTPALWKKLTSKRTQQALQTDPLLLLSQGVFHDAEVQGFVKLRVIQELLTLEALVTVYIEGTDVPLSTNVSVSDARFYATTQDIVHQNGAFNSVILKVISYVEEVAVADIYLWEIPSTNEPDSIESDLPLYLPKGTNFYLSATDEDIVVDRTFRASEEGNVSINIRTVNGGSYSKTVTKSEAARCVQPGDYYVESGSTTLCMVYGVTTQPDSPLTPVIKYTPLPAAPSPVTASAHYL